MNNGIKQPSIYGTMKSIIDRLNSPQEQKNLNKNLAVLRNSIGKSIEEATEIWSIVIPMIPPEFLGNGTLSYEEKALISALQLYAIGQQGTEKTMEEDVKSSFGKSLRGIRSKEDSTALDRRFNTMITSTSFEEFSYHLRQLFKLGTSKAAFTVNYPALASDLFWYQNGRSREIGLKWASDYYRADRTCSEE